MKSLARSAGIGLLFIAGSFAQEGQRFTFDVGGGFTNPVGNTGRHVDEGWNIQGGFGYNFTSWLGAKIDLGYNSFGINSATLNNFGVPGGSVQVFSATLDPVVHLNPKGHVDVYVTGGGGLFHRYQNFTQPTTSVFTTFDPFFGFYPVAVPTNQVLASYSSNKPGIDVGAGIAIGTRFHGKIFAEAKYDRIYNGNYHTDYVPVTFGFRW
ncbi:MAG TPA: outer membrane beta-barrel protein [Bryobacteraceae bacterium]|nr:outer membrane beta-barrel protein [Bryobacteraceae bacterium]